MQFKGGRFWKAQINMFNPIILESLINADTQMGRGMKGPDSVKCIMGQEILCNNRNLVMFLCALWVL